MNPSTKKIEKAVPYWADGKPSCTWIEWNGQNFRHDPKPPSFSRWSLDSYLRYCRAASEFLDEVANNLQLIVWYASGPREVPTSFAHRRAVAEELWFRDMG